MYLITIQSILHVYCEADTLSSSHNMKNELLVLSSTRAGSIFPSNGRDKIWTREFGQILENLILLNCGI